uniref:Uncharacterized protein n=1 Tax=Pristionchus pacificus TaxID=54126 RepID=A0A2A6BWR9_PRIPA|eukprot:PDM70364.1 hypothetical protein PRIPAC_46610 [Pristionchus pacificus]
MDMVHLNSQLLHVLQQPGLLLLEHFRLKWMPWSKTSSPISSLPHPSPSSSPSFAVGTFWLPLDSEFAYYDNYLWHHIALAWWTEAAVSAFMGSFLLRAEMSLEILSKFRLELKSK